MRVQITHAAAVKPSNSSAGVTLVPDRLRREGVNVDGDIKAWLQIDDKPYTAGHTKDRASAGPELNAMEMGPVSKKPWWKKLNATEMGPPPEESEGKKRYNFFKPPPPTAEWKDSYGRMHPLGSSPHYSKRLPGVNVNSNPFCGSVLDGRVPLDCDPQAYDDAADFLWR
jgi:hypothetical protein